MKYKLECSKCKTQNDRKSKTIIKKGFYSTSQGKTPRYFCKACKTHFSNRSKRTKGQKKPELTKDIYKLYSSGITLNRMATILKVSKPTIIKRTLWFADLIKKYHEKLILSKVFLSNLVIFDEMETYEHTKYKPISMPLAVNGDGKILDIRTASMKAKGRIPKAVRDRYQDRVDNRNAICLEVFETISRCVLPDFKLITDSKRAYIGYFNDTFGGGRLVGEHIQVISRKNQKNEFDQMFKLNHTCAMMRSYISRLQRRTWATTKDPKMLQAHLYLFLAYQNGYKVEDIIDLNIKGYIESSNPKPPKLKVIQGGEKSA